MKQLFPNIFLLPADFSLGFSYFVQRPAGNLLIPNGLMADELNSLVALLDGMGGVSIVLACCKHNVKAASVTAAVCAHYGAPLLIGAPDTKGGMIAGGKHVRALKFKEAALGPDLDFIPLIGYSSGSAGYLWRNNGRAYLFTGVTLAHTDGVWRVWTSAPKAANCVAGFKRMKELAFDVLFLNSYSNTPPAWFEWSQDEKNTVLDLAISHVTL